MNGGFGKSFEARAVVERVTEKRDGTRLSDVCKDSEVTDAKCFALSSELGEKIRKFHLPKAARGAQ